MTYVRLKLYCGATAALQTRSTSGNGVPSIRHLELGFGLRNDNVALIEDFYSEVGWITHRTREKAIPKRTAFWRFPRAGFSNIGESKKPGR
jgi:hypothetical protein